METKKEDQIKLKISWGKEIFKITNEINKIENKKKEWKSKDLSLTSIKSKTSNYNDVRKKEVINCVVNSNCKSLGQSRTKKLFHCCVKLKKKNKMDDFNKVTVNLIFPFNKKINDIRSVKSKLKKE